MTSYAAAAAAAAVHGQSVLSISHSTAKQRRLTKSCGLIWAKFSKTIDFGPRRNRSDFGDPKTHGEIGGRGTYYTGRKMLNVGHACMDGSK